MQVVYKASSTTTKVRAVFDAFTKSSIGVSLNDMFLVGPTVHPPLIDVLLNCHLHTIALTANVSKMVAVNVADWNGSEWYVRVYTTLETGSGPFFNLFIVI